MTTLFIIGTDTTIYLTVQPWQTQILLYLLTLLFILPIWIASKKINQLFIQEEELKIQQDDMVKQVKQLEENKNQLYEFIDSFDATVFSLDTEKNKWFVSKNISEMIKGADLDRPLDLMLEENIHPDDRKQFLKNKLAWFTDSTSTSEYRIVQDNDHSRWIEIRTNGKTNSSGKVNKIYGVIIDITAQKEKQESLAQMAFYDSLTNLPNRIMLKSHLRKAISRARRKEHDITVMFLDLDGFKNVNDTMGHDIGDALLKEVANRLNESVREEDLISRLGGDEFIIVFEETNKDEVSMIADRVLRDISAPYTILDHNISISPSIGIATYPDDALDMENLIKNADKAMYLAKDKGKANYQFYTKELENYQLKESIIEKVLKFFQK